MAQFIYLSLLLATIQLSLVKVTITCDLAGNGEAECDCFSCDANHHDTGINNRRHDRGTYLCYDSPTQNHQCRIKAAECTKLDLHGDARHAANNRWKCCTDYSACQYVTFHSNKRCFLISSMDGQGQGLSWSSLKNCNVSKNDAAPVTSCPESGSVTQGEVHEDAGLKFVEEEKSWIYALDHCYGMTSSLVEITNSTVRNAVESLLESKTVLQKGVWIGLERSIFGKPDRPWKWISGSDAKDDEPPWNSSLVDPLNNHCGKIIRDEGSEELKWGDGDCHDKLPFICQAKLNCFP